MADGVLSLSGVLSSGILSTPQATALPIAGSATADLPPSTIVHATGPVQGMERLFADKPASGGPPIPPGPDDHLTGLKLLERLIEALDRSRLIRDLLDVPFSPNHPKGVTTASHVLDQNGIFDVLTMLHTVASLMSGRTPYEATRQEIRALEFVARGQFRALHRMIFNPSLPNSTLVVSLDDIINYFAPLFRGISPDDLVVLAFVVMYHDLGKLSPQRVREKKNEGIDIEGITFIAHEYASRALLEKNPQLIEGFGLSSDQLALALDLVERHSAIGQYVFGEASLAVLDPILEHSRRTGSDVPLRLARIHGTIDTMSALGRGFVRPILLSHIRFGKLVEDAYARSSEGATLEHIFEEESRAGTTNLPQDLLHAVSLYRLMKLTGLANTVEDGKIIFEAIQSLDQGFVRRFDEATRGAEWSGTYVANAFGTGIKKWFGKEPKPEEMRLVVQTVIKMVAAASLFNSRIGHSPFAVSAIGPGLAVQVGSHEDILAEISSYRTLEEAVERLLSGAGRLYIAGESNQVEIGYREP